MHLRYHFNEYVYTKTRLLTYFVITSLFCLVLVKPTIAQVEYIKTDTSSITGVDVIVRTPSSNSKFIDVAFKNETVTFSPDQISEYGTSYGTVFVSKEITLSGTSKRVFLEQLNKGNVNFYYYREKRLTTFFIERISADGVEFSQVERGEHRNTLSEFFADKEWISDPIKIVKYKKKTLSKLASLYNNGEPRPFPYARFGISVGYGLTDMSVSPKFGFALRNSSISQATEIIRATPLPADPAPTIGVFADVPILLGDLSLNTGIYFSKNDYSIVSESSIFRREIFIEISTVEVPVLIRYTFPRMNLRPYTNLGVVFSRHTSNDNALYQTVLTIANQEKNNIATDSFVSDNLTGLSLGGGVQRNIDYKKTISAELRMSKFFGNSRSLGKNQVNLIVSLTI